MIQNKEIKRIQLANESILSELRSHPQSLSSSFETLLAQTTRIDTYPTAAQQFYACQIVSILGAENEGNPAIFVPGNSQFFALNVGQSIPPTGTMVIVTFVNNRWIFKFDG